MLNTASSACANKNDNCTSPTKPVPRLQAEQCSACPFHPVPPVYSLWRSQMRDKCDDRIISWPVAQAMTPARLLLPGERCTHRLTSSYGTRLGASVEFPYILPSSCPHPASGPWDWINAGHSLSTAHRNKQTGIRFLVSTLVPNSLEPGMILFPNPACSHPDPRHPKHWQSAAKYPLPCRCPSLIRQVIDCR